MSITRFEVPMDTGQFSAQQLHPRVALALSMNAWARWLREHLVPFRKLIAKYKTGVVIVGIDIEYLRPFTFFSADAFDIAVDTKVRRDGSLLHFKLAYAPDDPFVNVTITGRIVTIGGGESLAAAPGVLPPELLERFDDDDLFDETPDRPLAGLLEAPTWGEEVERPFVVHRALCEAADQWSFIELPTMIGDAREALALEQAGQPNIARALAVPLKRFVAELRRPHFIFDSSSVKTQVDAGCLHYRHRIEGPKSLHATIYEHLAES